MSLHQMRSLEHGPTDSQPRRLRVAHPPNPPPPCLLPPALPAARRVGWTNCHSPRESREEYGIRHLTWEAASRPRHCPPKLEMSLEVAKGMWSGASAACYHSPLQAINKPLHNPPLGPDTASESVSLWCPGQPAIHQGDIHKETYLLF